jgi:hypothetical protein
MNISAKKAKTSGLKGSFIPTIPSNTKLSSGGFKKIKKKLKLKPILQMDLHHLPIQSSQPHIFLYMK